MPIQIDSIIVLVGIFLLSFSLILCSKIKLISNNKKPWFLLSFLITIFIVGYIYYIYEAIDHNLNNNFASIIYLFGSIFVLFIFKVMLKTVQELNYDLNELQKTHKELNQLHSKLKNDHKEIEANHSEITLKNIELRETLEDFYTLRLSMEKDNSKKTKDDNKKIKQKLNKLKL